MSLEAYLATTPLRDLVKREHGAPKDGVKFTGVARKHPYDETKCLIVTNPLSGDTEILEFRIEDIIFAEDAQARVNERGESAEIVAIWVRKGSIGIRYEPFSVEEPLRFMRSAEELRRPQRAKP